jgi:hypothetical protein
MNIALVRKRQEEIAPVACLAGSAKGKGNEWAIANEISQ